MYFAVLGPLEVWRDGTPVRVAGNQLRTVLATLLLRANRPVAVDVLVDRLWPDLPPREPRALLHSYVARLRRTLGGAGHDLIRTADDGYLIQVGPDQVDLLRFVGLLDDARRVATADPAAELELLTRALDLWRGEPLRDLGGSVIQLDEIPRLTERWQRAVERRVELELAVRDPADLVGELRVLTARYPLRERLWGFLMRALCGAGREPEALEAYRTVERALREELGLDPSGELRELQRTILAGTDSSTVDARVVCDLPLDVADFVGRGALLDPLRDFLAPAAPSGVPVAVLHGPPGAGKSALAIRVAHRLAAAFPDGQWYLRLGGPDQPGMDSFTALGHLLRLAGLPDGDQPDTVDARSAALRTRLSGRRVLMVLDDVVNAAEAVPLLPGAAGSAVIVTARGDLRGLGASCGAQLFPVGPLSPAQAYRLLTTTIGARLVAAEAEPLRELARLCGNLPLALRIAAATVAGRPRGAVAGLVAALCDGGPLDGLAVDGVGLRNTVERTFDAVSPPARRLFRLLALVAEPEVSVPAAAALGGLAPASAAALLAQLAAVGLVRERTAGRYRLTDLMRQFAREQRGPVLPVPSRPAGVRTAQVARTRDSIAVSCP